jgi:CRP-like cAMP-binding protein
MAAAKVVELPIKATLYEPDSTPSYAYFLTSGLASIITPMANGDSGEVGFVGYEGIVGSLHLLGSARIPSRCVMQLAGKGLRIAFARICKELLRILKKPEGASFSSFSAKLL